MVLGRGVYGKHRNGWAGGGPDQVTLGFNKSLYSLCSRGREAGRMEWVEKDEGVRLELLLFPFFLDRDTEKTYFINLMIFFKKKKSHPEYGSKFPFLFHHTSTNLGTHDPPFPPLRKECPGCGRLNSLNRKCTSESE